MSQNSWPPGYDTPGPLVLDMAEERIKLGEAVRPILLIRNLVSWAHRELLEDEAGLERFYNRILATFDREELRGSSKECLEFIIDVMEFGPGEQDRWQVANYVAAIGAISCLGVTFDYPTQRRFERVLAEFTKKRHPKRALRASIHAMRDEDPLWSQPFCQTILEAL